jgi:hypothetical protein
MKLEKLEIEEIKNIADNQPVFSGNVLSKESAHSLCEKKLAMIYEGEYVLTEAGKIWVRNYRAAEKIRDSGILYKNK